MSDLRRVLVCGPSKVVWPYTEQITEVLEMFRLAWNELYITGGAPKLDADFARIARPLGYHVADVPALWTVHNRKAGPIRNRAMMTLMPTHGVAFDLGTPGTSDMIRVMEKAGVPVIRVWPGRPLVSV